MPGSQFVANVGGQLVNVPCPPHMKPGQTLSVAVAGDAALELGEVKVARPGKARTPAKLKLGSPSAKLKGGNFEPDYGFNVGSARMDSPGRPNTGRGQESPGRGHRQDSPGRASARSASPRPDSPGRGAPLSSGRKPAPAKPRQASPMSRLFGSKKGK